MEDYLLDSIPMDQHIEMNDFWFGEQDSNGFNSEPIEENFFATEQDSQLLGSDIPFFDASPNTLLNNIQLDQDQNTFLDNLIPEFDIKLEPQNLLPQKRHANLFANQIIGPKKTKTENVKKEKRLEANKRSAQASRDRKKQLKEELEEKVEVLSQEKTEISSEITRLKAENDVMKRELVSLHEMIGQSPLLSKMMERAQTQSLYNINRTEPASTTSPAAAQWYTFIAMHMYLQHFNETNQNQNVSAALVA
eukprot:TRINITY_DN4977_c0_g1_i1.p1 TRINITY_DN4977_c0_g1~~TRINITY_DN4977_c0_g1_i1.p1  ORF type:complete len:250 (-),score=68.58 TRINITY_DN4977_c0_g1_i1:130-879(-)